MKFEDNMQVSDISQSHKNTLEFHKLVYVLCKVVKFIEQQSRMMDTSICGVENRDLLFKGYRDSIADRNVLESNSITARIYLTLTSTVKPGYIVTFILLIKTHFSTF